MSSRTSTSREGENSEPSSDLIAFDALGSSRVVAYQVALAHAVKSATAGLLLSQLWYWSKHTSERDRDGWFYKTMDDIQEETALTRSEQMTARKKLVDLGLLEEKREGLPARMWFRVNVAQIRILLGTTGSENKSAGNRKLDSRKSKTAVRKPANQSAQNLHSITGEEITHQTTQKSTAAEPTNLSAAGSDAASAAAVDAELIKALTEAGVNRSDAKRLARELPDECRRQLEYLPFAGEFKTSQGAYLRSAIEQGFAPPSAWQRAQDEQAAEMRRQTVRQTQDQKNAQAQAERERTDALKARIQAEQPDRWEALTREAEAQLPQLIRSRPNGHAYRAALDVRLTELIRSGM
jgi:hypothetical protein